MTDHKACAAFGNPQVLNRVVDASAATVRLRSLERMAFAGERLRSFPLQPLPGSACPGSGPPPPCEGAGSPSPVLSSVALG